LVKDICIKSVFQHGTDARVGFGLLYRNGNRSSGTIYLTRAGGSWRINKILYD
jgi:hypothetical protein